MSYLASLHRKSHASKTNLVTKFGESLCSLVVAGSLLGLGELSSLSLLSFVVCGALGFSSLLESMTLVSIFVHSPFCRISSYLATTSWYFHPTSCDKRPTVQNFRPGFNRSTLKACGTTIRCFLSYGGGTPSKTFSLSMAAAPRAVLCGIMPRTAL